MPRTITPSNQYLLDQIRTLQGQVKALQQQQQQEVSDPTALHPFTGSAVKARLGRLTDGSYGLQVASSPNCPSPMVKVQGPSADTGAGADLAISDSGIAMFLYGAILNVNVSLALGSASATFSLTGPLGLVDTKNWELALSGSGTLDIIGNHWPIFYPVFDDNASAGTYTVSASSLVNCSVVGSAFMMAWPY